MSQKLSMAPSLKTRDKRRHAWKRFADKLSKSSRNRALLQRIKFEKPTLRKGTNLAQNQFSNQSK